MTNDKEELIATYKELLQAKEYISKEDFDDIRMNILDAMSLLELKEENNKNIWN